jgi:hypothetical protein
MYMGKIIVIQRKYINLVKKSLIKVTFSTARTVWIDKPTNKYLKLFLFVCLVQERNTF